ncbi:YIP1 family protein [Chromobacterium sp. CV08]|uniref:YIP1 family protein n=1 Tax=Chromobacterium sp. CV08 TaxID=3133274 RepID=UPI003DA82F09
MNQTSVLADPAAAPGQWRLLAGIVQNPVQAFRQIAARPRSLLPLSLIVAGTALLYLWYYGWVDFAWLRERLLDQLAMPGNREAALKAVTRPLMLGSSIAGALITLPLSYLLLALYFHGVGKLRGLGIGLRQWYALVVWSSTPALLALLSGAVQILAASAGRLEPSQLDPLSLNQLLFHLDVGHAWAGVLDSVDLGSFWKLALLAIGYKTWSGDRWPVSAAVAWAPAALFYGVWIAVKAW